MAIFLYAIENDQTLLARVGFVKNLLLTSLLKGVTLLVSVLLRVSMEKNLVPLANISLLAMLSYKEIG